MLRFYNKILKIDNDRLKTGSALVILRKLEANNFKTPDEKQKLIERKY